MDDEYTGTIRTTHMYIAGFAIEAPQPDTERCEAVRIGFKPTSDAREVSKPMNIQTHRGMLFVLAASFIMLLCGCESDWTTQPNAHSLSIPKRQYALPNPGPRTVETPKKHIGEYKEYERENSDRHSHK